MDDLIKQKRKMCEKIGEIKFLFWHDLKVIPPVCFLNHFYKVSVKNYFSLRSMYFHLSGNFLSVLLPASVRVSNYFPSQPFCHILLLHCCQVPI